MQKIKTKISKASIYQFENFFHLSSLNESFSSSYSDKNQLKVVANILKNDSIKAIDITHFNSPPSIIPSKYYDKSIRAKYLETNSKISRGIEEDISSDKKITVIPTMQITAEANTVVGFRVISTGPLRVKNKNLFSRKNQTRSRIMWCVSRSLLYQIGGNSLINL